VGGGGSRRQRGRAGLAARAIRRAGLAAALADRIVFGHAVPAWNRLIRYHGASAGALVVYWLVINGLALFFNLPYVVAFVLGTGAAFIWSLISNFLWVWAA
jgi:putative flippase GtrA